MHIAAMIIRLFLSVILIRAALHKFRDRKNFEAELKAYQLLPESFLSIAAVVLFFTEALTALMLLNVDWKFPVLIAAFLLFTYSLAMAINLLKGRIDIDCGCTGPSGAKKTISWPLVFRNLVLVFLALLCVTPQATPSVSGPEQFMILAGTAVSLLLYETIEQAIANAQGYKRWIH
jgi:uncharacterized membrane protein YphA (DoxX/SURF4 family)